MTATDIKNARQALRKPGTTAQLWIHDDLAVIITKTQAREIFEQIEAMGADYAERWTVSIYSDGIALWAGR